MKYIINTLIFMATYWWAFGLLFAISGLSKIVFSLGQAQ